MYEAGALWGWGLSRQKNQTDSGVETQDSVCQGRGTQMSCGCSVAILERRGEEWWGPLAAAKTTLEVCVCNRLISQASFWAPETSCSPKARGVLSGITGEWAPNESGCQGTPCSHLPSFLPLPQRLLSQVLPDKREGPAPGNSSRGISQGFGVEVQLIFTSRVCLFPFP